MWKLLVTFKMTPTFYLNCKIFLFIHLTFRFKQLKLRATEEIDIANKNSSDINEISKKQVNSSELSDSHLNGKTEIENKSIDNQLTVQTQIGGNLKDLISLLQDLCNLAKNLQAQSRVSFYQ